MAGGNGAYLSSPVTLGSTNTKMGFREAQAKTQDTISKITNTKTSGGVAQMV
jgi:hypothetical protein